MQPKAGYLHQLRSYLYPPTGLDQGFGPWLWRAPDEERSGEESDVEDTRQKDIRAVVPVRDLQKTRWQKRLATTSIGDTMPTSSFPQGNLHELPGWSSDSPIP